MGEKTVTIEKELDEHENIAQAIDALLSEIDQLSVFGKATSADLSTLRALGLARGWSHERMEGFLEEKLGTSKDDEIIGKVGVIEISELISEMIQAPGKATDGQVRALWAVALDKGWSRQKIKDFLEDRFGTTKTREIVEKVDRNELSEIIDEIDKSMPSEGNSA